MMIVCHFLISFLEVTECQCLPNLFHVIRIVSQYGMGILGLGVAMQSEVLGENPGVEAIG